MTTDTVPNIRFNVAKGLEKMASVVGRSAVGAQIRPVLAMFAEDRDRDVGFYAKQTMDAIEGL